MAISIGVIVILMAATIGIAIAMIVSGKYPIKVVVFEKRANGFIIKNCKAGRVKNPNSGVYEYKMKIPKFPFGGETKTTKPQEYENIYMDQKGKPILFVYSDGKDQYVPCGIEMFAEMLQCEVKVLDEDLRQFQVHSYRDSDIRYKGKSDIWAKYGNVITLGVLAVSILLIFYGSRYLYYGISIQNAESLSILSGLKTAAGTAIGSG